LVPITTLEGPEADSETSPRFPPPFCAVVVAVASLFE
jgi:hypothetical protein